MAISSGNNLDLRLRRYQLTVDPTVPRAALPRVSQISPPDQIMPRAANHRKPIPMTRSRIESSTLGEKACLDSLATWLGRFNINLRIMSSPYLVGAHLCVRPTNLNSDPHPQPLSLGEGLGVRVLA